MRTSPKEIGKICVILFILSILFCIFASDFSISYGETSKTFVGKIYAFAIISRLAKSLGNSIWYKIGYTRQSERKLSLPSLALSLE